MIKFFEKHRKLSRLYALLFRIYWYKECPICGEGFGVHESAEHTYWQKFDRQTLRQEGFPVCWKCDSEAKRLSELNDIELNDCLAVHAKEE